MTESDSLKTTCCIAGGGPAGMMLGYLLARAGVDVVVLEKHADFLRDFRGDTIHPSTYEIFYELGLLEEILAITDFKVESANVNFDGREQAGPTVANLRNTQCKFIGFTPQWNLLNLLATKAKAIENFKLRMNTNATGLLRDGSNVVGLKCEGKTGEYEIRANLIVGADGRSSTLRSATDLKVIEHGIPIDVLWFRLNRPQGDDGHTLAWMRDGHALITIPRKDYYQVAMIIRKDTLEQIKAPGLEKFRETIGKVCPPLRGASQQLPSWDDVKLLSVRMNRLEKWHEPGLLFIGDAAHAMSPVGGVGINLAIQDAVAAANLLTSDLLNRSLEGTISEATLAGVQKRREPAARRTQRFQAIVHQQLFGGKSQPGKPIQLSWYFRLFLRLFAPILRPLAGRIIGLGFQPEHVETAVRARTM